MKVILQLLLLASVLLEIFCIPCPCCGPVDPKPTPRSYYLGDPWPRPCPYSDPSDPSYVSLPIGIRPKPIPKVKICCSADPNSGYLDPCGRYHIKPKVSVYCSGDPNSVIYAAPSQGDPVGSDPDPAGGPVKLCSCCLYPDGASCPQCFSVYQHQ